MLRKQKVRKKEMATCVVFAAYRVSYDEPKMIMCAGERESENTPVTEKCA